MRSEIIRLEVENQTFSSNQAATPPGGGGGGGVGGKKSSTSNRKDQDSADPSDSSPSPSLNVVLQSKEEACNASRNQENQKKEEKFKIKILNSRRISP